MAKTKFSQIEFHGAPGATEACLEAIARLLQFGNQIVKAALLTHGNSHCFLLTLEYGERVAIKSGFSSGYAGTGPHGLAIALQLLERHGAETQEYEVSEDIIDAIDESCLRMSQLDRVHKLRPRRPTRLFDYVYAPLGDRAFDFDHNLLNDKFPVVLPFALIDPRTTDLAISFPFDPDRALLTAFRRLEDLVREKAALPGEGSSRLFSKAFQGDTPALIWEELDSSEQKARASLFDAAYRAYRNPRAHKERDRRLDEDAREFLLINELFHLESSAIQNR